MIFSTLFARLIDTTIKSILLFFTISSHIEKKKSLLLMNVHVLYILEHKMSKKNSVCLSVCLFVCLYGCTYVRGSTWILAVGTIAFEGVSGSKQNLVGVFYVWNVGLVLKSKVQSWSWSWTGFWFWQKLCEKTPNLVGIFSIPGKLCNRCFNRK